MIFNQLYSQVKKQGGRFYFTHLYPLILERRAKAIGKKDKIEVVFFAFNVAMWRYQGVYDLLSKDMRFNCHVVLTVPKTYTAEQKRNDLKQMRAYFDAQGIEYKDYDEKDEQGFDVKGLINPDILFYPQPYAYIYPANHEFFLYTDKLLCYVPYALIVIDANSWTTDLPFHNRAWKIFCASQYEKESAMSSAKNHGRNWVVSGYPNLDLYLDKELNDVWKIKDKRVKRLIWAPHFTMTKVSWLTPRSNFLWMSQLMMDVAEQYKGRLQIAFKPHPRLKSELYRHPDWGKEKTDEYYQRWANMENTQLETGGFVDLFKTSDAMIHDCGSFTAEYLYVNKPVAFITADVDALKADHNAFGQAALDEHYIVGNKNEVLTFIETVVLAGQDSKKAQRTDFFENVLKPNVSGTTSAFVVNELKTGLGLA